MDGYCGVLVGLFIFYAGFSAAKDTLDPVSYTHLEDNPQGLGCYLVMTSRGCDDIFRILDSRNYTFGDMFRRCERRYGLDNFHFTRPVSYTHLDVYKRQEIYRVVNRYQDITQIFI